MVRKAIHHFNRGLIVGAEIIGVAAVVVFLAWLGLMWRLSQGPLNVDFLTEKLEKSLNGQQGGFLFDVGATQLVWGGKFEPFELEMQNVRIARQDNTPVLAVEKVGIQISKRNIVFGRVVPKVIKVYGPALRVNRGEDGRYSLNLAGGNGEEDNSLPQDASAHVELIKNFLVQMEGSPSHLILGGLDEINVSNAAVFYEDKVLGIAWRSRKADIVFARSGRGLVASVIAALDMGEEKKEAIIRANFVYSWKSRHTSAEVYFGDFVPAYAAQESEKLRNFSGVILPLKGKVGFRLDENFKMGKVDFIIGSDPGTLNAFGLYPQPLDVRGLYVAGQYDVSTGGGAVELLKVNLGGPLVEGRMRVTPEKDGGLIEVQASLGGLPLDDLHRFWPEKLTPDPRFWVTEHLSKGMADKATLDGAFLYQPEAEKKVVVRKLGGQIDFHGVKVDYFPPLMPVQDVSGKAHYDVKSFNLDIFGGKLGDMTASEAVIHITDLDKAHSETEHADIDIAVSLSGSLKTALGVLDSKPLEYPKMLGLKTEEIGGVADVNVSFAFPLHKKLSLKEIKVKADAKIDDVRLSDVVAGLTLYGGPMDLKLTGNTLSVKGSGRLGTMPVTFDWMRNFGAGAAESSRLTAGLPLDASALRKFGLPNDLKFSGSIPAEISYVSQKDRAAQLSLKGSITQASFEVPAVGFQKPLGEVGSLGLNILLRDGRPVKITGLDLATAQAVVKGDIDFAVGADGAFAFSKGVFNDVRLGETAIALSVENSGAGGYVLDIRGRQFDASRMFARSDTPGDDAAMAVKTTPIKLTMEIDRLLTGKNKAVDKIKMFLHRNEWHRIEQLEMDGVSGGKPIYLRYMPAAGGHTLRFEADNAGAALSALGLSKAVVGGRLVVKGDPYPKSGARDLAGTAILTDFTLKEVPVLAKLLNAMSLIGIVELLNGEGISFKKARVDFTWLDRGPPVSGPNMRLIKLKDGQTSGASLGLTFEGNIDNWKQIYDLNGTIIPVSDVSKLISIIPIVGDVLTAGGGGVFAATYTIKGPKDQPSVMVNPLAALAPGILRKLFFEN